MKEGRTTEVRGGTKKDAKVLEVERARHGKSRRYGRAEVSRVTKAEDLRGLGEFQVLERRDRDRSRLCESYSLHNRPSRTCHRSRVSVGDRKEEVERAHLRQWCLRLKNEKVLPHRPHSSAASSGSHAVR